MCGIWINIQRMEGWHRGICFDSLLKAPCLCNTCIHLTTNNALVGVWHPSPEPTLVLPPSSSSSNAGTDFHASNLLPGRVGVRSPPACISPNTSGLSVRLWRLCQMEKHQENQCLSSLMLVLLPTVLRINWVNPGQRDRLLSSCGHSKLWSDLDISFHVLATLLHLSDFKII